MNARETIEAYYSALRAGDPLAPFFASDGDRSVVKFGISEQLVGTDTVRAGLRAQTETTMDWTVDSHALRVTDREDYAWFSDAVELCWTDAEGKVRHEYDTRWSGTLEATGEAREWQFVGMHVSTADDLTQ
ncbi:nuclear transport factor 2 family protein [Haloarcula sp. S1AR25-5A]|uniref:Nuclear transport factor 2 family protein n=1 Tax=Haloarcula terrestris TaxID=2950533 RepID=A0AAE4JHE9_9EURY|nr:nuclear transport factor 2 family protein [Haloarcula terrestris]MDS0220086.1 nuclear transport factor 2 family protein [Haloarcula terrestris]